VLEGSERRTASAKEGIQSLDDAVWGAETPIEWECVSWWAVSICRPQLVRSMTAIRDRPTRPMRPYLVREPCLNFGLDPLSRERSRTPLSFAVARGGGPYPAGE
jgi:hypothetical protein